MVTLGPIRMVFGEGLKITEHYRGRVPQDGQPKAQTITIGNTASWIRLRVWIAEILAFPGIGERISNSLIIEST